MNKKLLLSLPVIALCFACNSNASSRELPFGKKFIYAGTYIENQDAEMQWLKENFEKIIFNGEEDATARYEYMKGGTIESETIINIESYDNLIEEIEEINLNLAQDITIIGTILTFEKDMNKEPNCSYVQGKIGGEGEIVKIELAGSFSLKVKQNTESIFELQGDGMVAPPDESKPPLPVNIAFSIVNWNDDNKINCTHFTILGGVDSSFKYIFPTNDGVTHTIDCYCNLLPVANY